MLVQLALVVFALCGLLSLVVDLGYARMTQGQMQNAADAAALEGLRNRDIAADPFQADCLRRAAANRMVRRTFDDDFDPASGDPDYQFGAGPVLDMTEGVTSVHALQTVTVPDPYVYKPDPQLNQQNAVYGDMVSGRFCYVTDPMPSEGGTYELQDLVCDEAQRGTGIYSRNDFNPNLTSPAPPATLAECPAADDPVPNPWPQGGTGSLTTANDSAFLVRLRRSNEFADSGGQVEPSTASSGPPLPLTFGKGAAIRGDDPDGGYSVRRDGLTVRATAIATIRPAVHLGLPQASTPAMATFALRDVCLAAPAGTAAGAAAALNVTINPVTGAITRAAGPAPVGCAAATVMGRFAANVTTLRTVGQVVPAAPVAATCIGSPSFTARYGIVYSQMSAGPDRIIGFVRLNFARVATCPGNATAAYTATITRLPSAVAPANATAILATGFPAGVPPLLVSELVNKNLARTGVDYGALLAPVLAR